MDPSQKRGKSNKKKRQSDVNAAEDGSASSRQEVVFELNAYDVLFGRTADMVNYQGNVSFRETVGARKEEYMGTGRHQKKDEIARVIVAAIWQKGGRFLRRKDMSNDDRTGADNDAPSAAAWEVVEVKSALQKVKQALRELEPYSSKPEEEDQIDENPSGHTDLNLPTPAASLITQRSAPIGGSCLPSTGGALGLNLTSLTRNTDPLSMLRQQMALASNQHTFHRPFDLDRLTNNSTSMPLDHLSFQPQISPLLFPNNISTALSQPNSLLPAIEEQSNFSQVSEAHRQIFMNQQIIHLQRVQQLQQQRYQQQQLDLLAQRASMLRPVLNPSALSSNGTNHLAWSLAEAQEKEIHLRQRIDELQQLQQPAQPPQQQDHMRIHEISSIQPTVYDMNPENPRSFSTLTPSSFPTLDSGNHAPTETAATVAAATSHVPIKTSAVTSDPRSRPFEEHIARKIQNDNDRKPRAKQGTDQNSASSSSASSSLSSSNSSLIETKVWAYSKPTQPKSKKRSRK